MQIVHLLSRGKNLLVNPTQEFRNIASEPFEVSRINKHYITPFALLIMISVLVNTVVSNLNGPASRFVFIGINAILVFLMVFSHAFVSGKIIALLGKNIADNTSSKIFYILSCYAQLPFFLVLALIKLFPSLVFLVFLGLYSGIVFYAGSGIITTIPPSKRLQFTMLSVLIMIISFIACSELFTLLYSQILNHFSTFAAI